MVVADVTPVGHGPDRPDKDGKPQKPKPLMNPNVAIELGYAYGKVSTESFLAVLNEAYGNVDSLPFDLIHRRHPVVYNLKEEAAKAEIESEKKKLIQQFVAALGPYLAGAAPASPAPQYAVDNLATLRSAAITDILNGKVSSDAELKIWEAKDETWQNSVLTVLRKHFSKAEVLGFEYLGVIQQVGFPHSFNNEHAFRLMTVAKRLSILEDIIRRYTR